MTLREIVDEELLKEEFNQEKANEIKNEIYNKLKTFKELENEKISVNEANPNYEKSNYRYLFDVKIGDKLFYNFRANKRANGEIEITGIQGGNSSKNKEILNNWKSVRKYMQKHGMSADNAIGAIEGIKKYEKIADEIIRSASDINIIEVEFDHYDENAKNRNNKYYNIIIDGNKKIRIRSDMTKDKLVEKINKIKAGTLSTKDLENAQIEEIEDKALENNNENKIKEGVAYLYTLREGTFTANNNIIYYNQNGHHDKTGSNGFDQILLYKGKIIAIELKNWSDLRYDRAIKPIEKLLKNLDNKNEKKYSIGVVELRDLFDVNKQERDNTVKQFNSLIKYNNNKTIINNSKEFNNYRAKDLISNNIPKDYEIYRISSTTDFIKQVIKPIRESVGFYVERFNTTNNNTVKQIAKDYKFKNNSVECSVFTKKTNLEKNISVCNDVLKSLFNCCQKMKNIGFKEQSINTEIYEINKLKIELNNIKKQHNMQDEEQKNTEQQEYKQAASIQTKYFNY